MKDLLTFRSDTLTSLGATEQQAQELLRYNENYFQLPSAPLPTFPLPDELFVEAWEEYGREVARAGSMAVLANYLVQLKFPIQAGMSADLEYLACTRRGAEPPAGAVAAGFPWRDATRCRMLLHPTAAGRIPCLIIEEREDFISLVRALARRNEPDPIPESMGACVVVGFNDWHRIKMLKRRRTFTEEEWQQEFQRIKARKELYQDTFIILSCGPYSGVQGASFGLDERRWQQLSLVIRREHECAHYFSRRVFSSVRNNLLDEMIADYFGIAAAHGNFRADWLMRFFGLESFPEYRESGRLGYYRRAPYLSDGAFLVLQRLLAAAARNLQRFDVQCVPAGQHLRLQPAIFMALAALTLEQMAAENGQEAMADALRNAMRMFTHQPGLTNVPAACKAKCESQARYK